MMTNPSMFMPGLSEQISIFLYAIFLGFIIGAVYDVFRITRVAFGVRYRKTAAVRHRNKKLPLISRVSFIRGKKIVDGARNVLVICGDVLFSLVAAVLVSVFIYRYNYGIIRWYVFAGVLAGFTVYYNTVGRVVIYISDFIIYVSGVAISYVLYFTLYPIVFLVKKLACAIRKIRRKKKTVEE